MLTFLLLIISLLGGTFYDSSVISVKKKTESAFSGYLVVSGNICSCA